MVQRICLVVSYLLMLYCTWLLFSGLTQTRIHSDVEAPVSGASMAIFYASGVFFTRLEGLRLVLPRRPAHWRSALQQPSAP